MISIRLILLGDSTILSWDIESEFPSTTLVGGNEPIYGLTCTDKKLYSSDRRGNIRIFNLD
jgi:hypothetical protein